jgi:PAS domain S-box-containing protein
MDDEQKTNQQLIAELNELRESESKWRSVVRNAPVFLAMCDRDFRTKFVNRYRPGFTDESVLGRLVFEFMEPEHHAVVQECLTRAIEFGENSSRAWTSSKSSTWYETHFGPVRVAGQIVGATLVSLDITERKRAEEALHQGRDELERRVEERTAELRASEARYRAVVEGQTEIINRFQADGTLTFVNEVLCRFFGKEHREMLGTRWQPAVVHEDLPEIERKLQTLSPENSVVVIENRVYAANGAVRWMQFVNHGFFDEQGCLVEVQSVGRDITERKNAEQVLAESEAKYRLLVETTDTGYAILDEHGRVVDANAEYIRMTGHASLTDILGRSVTEWTVPGDLDRNAQEVQKCLETGAVRRLEVQYQGPNGEAVPIEINASVIQADKGTRIISLMRDVTERKLAEEALARQHHTLKHLLQSSDHERQVIAYEIHDGLAQQLAAAIMQLQVFDHLKERSPKEAAQAYDAGLTMLRQAHFETRRLIAGVRPPVLDESGVVEAIAHLVHEQSREKGPKIDSHSRVDFDRLVPALENAIYRICQEALTNACKHSKSERVRIGLFQRNDRIRLEVRDWGVGFDARAVSGNRFGLEGIRQRAKLLGGKCSIRSQQGRGTWLIVELPVIERDPDE